MKTLRWMCEHTRLYRIRLVVERESERLIIAHVSIMLCENTLRLFGHVERKTTNAPARNENCENS